MTNNQLSFVLDLQFVIRRGIADTVPVPTPRCHCRLLLLAKTYQRG